MRTRIPGAHFAFVAVIAGVLTFALTLLCTNSLYAAGTPAGTVIANQTTATYSSALGRGPMVVNSNIVGIVVDQVAVINVLPPAASRTAQLATPADFPVRLTNSGNGQDNFLLTTTSAEGLPTAVYRDVDRNAVLSPSELAAGPITQSGSLAADSMCYVLIRVTVPNTQSLNGRTDVARLTATSGFDPSRSAVGLYSTVITSANLATTKSVNIPAPRAGDRVMYTVTITNTGFAPAANIVVTDILSSNLRFATGSATPNPTSLSGQTVTWQLGTLEAQTSRTITFHVDLVNNVPPSTEIHNVASVQFNDGPNVVAMTSSETNFITVRSGGPTTVDVSADQQQRAEPGDTVIYRYVITNNGQMPEGFDLALRSSLGIRWALIQDSNDNGVVDDGEPEVTTTGMLAGLGGTFYALVRATMPMVTSDQTTDVFSLVVSSPTNPDNYVTRLGSTTIGLPVMVLTKTASSQNPIAGEEIVYLITYTNNGNGTAYQFVVSDQVPAFTEYVAGSIVHNGARRTDATDADEADVSNGILRIAVGTVSPRSSGAIEFRVRIQ